MRITMFITEESLQINLTPENDHEREGLAYLNSYNGEARIHQGVNIQETRGDYLRSFETSQNDPYPTVAIKIDKSNPKKSNEPIQ